MCVYKKKKKKKKKKIYIYIYIYIYIHTYMYAGVYKKALEHRRSLVVPTPVVDANYVGRPDIVFCERRDLYGG